MKKIKPTLKKTKVQGLAKIGIFLHAHLRHKLVALTASWYNDLAQKLSSDLELNLFLSGVSDHKLDEIADDYGFTRIQVAAGNTLGVQLNEGLSALKAHSLDAVIPVASGDFLMSELLFQYAEHLSQGGLLGGLLDQYFYDPNEFKCMHWARGEIKEGLNRACDLGLMLSSNLLDQLKWQLWPSQSTKKLDVLHQAVMERIGKITPYAPAKTCLLKTMEAYGGKAFTFKSELARALFDEGNWLRHLAQSDADFESIFMESMGEDWLSKVDLFDERVVLDIIVEAPDAEASHFVLWLEHYEFLPYKFDPYAQVRLRVISNANQADHQWAPMWEIVNNEPDMSRGQAWNQAVNEAVSNGADLVLFGGKGSLVDLKTIEHYIIFAMQKGTQLMSISNFFVAFEEGHQAHFWPGHEGLGFQRALSFGSCVHSNYLKRLGENIFDDQGLLNPESQDRFNLILNDTANKHQRVMFQLVRHELGLIAFEIDGAFGFSDLIHLDDLKPIFFLQHLHNSTYLSKQRDQLSGWEAGEIFIAGSKTAPQLSIPSHPIIKESTEMSSDLNPTGNLSALERAKALLKQPKESSSTNDVVESSTDTSDDSSSTETAQPMSALERAKALLQAKSNTETANPPMASEETTSGETEAKDETPSESPDAKPLSALERAKLLLKSANSGTESKPDHTQVLLQQAMKGAEAMIGQLQATADAAKAMVTKEKENISQLADDAGADSPGILLCQKGEQAFANGDVAQAQTLFDSALVVDPGCIRALNNLGVLALQGDESWKALSYFLMGLIQNPSDEDILINLRGLFDLNPELNTVKSVLFD